MGRATAGSLGGFQQSPDIPFLFGEGELTPSTDGRQPGTLLAPEADWSMGNGGTLGPY
jgi:hypothetical protein